MGDHEIQKFSSPKDAPYRIVMKNGQVLSEKFSKEITHFKNYISLTLSPETLTQGP